MPWLYLHLYLVIIIYSEFIFIITEVNSQSFIIKMMDIDNLIPDHKDINPVLEVLNEIFTETETEDQEEPERYARG